MNSQGITIIVILLVPIAFQVFMLSINQRKFNKEILEKLDKLLKM